MAQHFTWDWFMLAIGLRSHYGTQAEATAVWSSFDFVASLLGHSIVITVDLAALRETVGYYLSDVSGFLLTGRLGIWARGWDMITHQPWGYGIGMGHALSKMGNPQMNEFMDAWYLKVLAERWVPWSDCFYRFHFLYCFFPSFKSQ